MVEAAWKDRARLEDQGVRDAVFETMTLLDEGKLRVAESANLAYRVPKSRRIALLRWWKPRAWGTFTR